MEFERAYQFVKDQSLQWLVFLYFIISFMIYFFFPDQVSLLLKLNQWESFNFLLVQETS